MRCRTKVALWTVSAALMAAVPAWGAVFTYDSGGFETVPDGTKPPGWWTGCLDNANSLPGLTALEPKVWVADPAGWSGVLGAESVVNYGVPWSGNGTTGHRFTIAHAGQGTATRAAEAWYIGQGEANYPMDLKHNSMKAEFDLAMRSGASGTRTHCFTFAVQPALDNVDFMYYGMAFGRGGWAMNGFSVEVDLFNNNAGIGQGNGYGDPSVVHCGVNVQSMWDPIGYGVQSLTTNVDQGVTIPWNWWQPGDNNQPLHFTVYYNDPAHGGAGHLQVYLKVKAADKDPADPPAPAGTTPFSFGEGGSDPAEGILVLDTCVGPWPGDGAIFGFTAGYSGSNHVSQVDNVKVETAAADTSNPCAPTFPTPDAGTTPYMIQLAGDPPPPLVALHAPEFDYIANYPGTGTYTVTAAPVQSDLTGLTQPGWTVYTYPDLSGYWNWTPILDFFERSIPLCDANGLAPATAIGQPEINYYDFGSGGSGTLTPLGLARPAGVGQPANFYFRPTMPGMGNFDNEWFGLLCKGWVYFPPDTDGSSPYPRTYNFCVASDNGARVWIGGEIILDSGNDGVFRGINAWNQNTPPGTVGLNAGWFRDVVINSPGVYPIQLMFNERWGGAYVEFYRRTPNAMAPFLPVGTSKCGQNDQPIVYGLRNGSGPATTLNPANTAFELPTVTLDPNQRVGDVDAHTGAQVFTCKTVWAPNRWQWAGEYGCGPFDDAALAYATGPDIYYSIDSDRRHHALRWLDFLDDRSGGATLADIRLGGGCWSNEFNPTGDFPGQPSNGLNFAFRAQGYAVFPEAGDYYLGTMSEDESTVQFGNQVVWTTGYFDQPGKVFRLHVDQPGTYPIRLDYSIGGGCRMVRFYEVTPGHSKVPVNDPLGRIKVYAGGPDFPYETRAIPIDAANKVADVGMGDPAAPGWNGTVARVTTGAVDIWMIAQTAMMVENDIAYPSAVIPNRVIPDNAKNTAAVPYVNFWTQFDAVDFPVNECMPWNTAGTVSFAPRHVDQILYWGDYFPLISTNNTVNDDRFAASFNGYIEFPTAGLYAFNVSAEDTGKLWIGGRVVSVKEWTNGWPYDTNPAVIYVPAAGIYDIRADYFEQYYNAIFTVFRYNPDGSTVLLGDPADTVKIYRSLLPPPPNTTWSTLHQNPTVVPLSSKVAPYNGGGQRGFHVQAVNAQFTQFTFGGVGLSGDGNGHGPGYDIFCDVLDAHDMLAAAFDGVPSNRQHPNMGTKVDYIVGPDVPLLFCPDCASPLTYPFPIARDWLSMRINGFLAMKAGGHMFSLANDDGVSFRIGGQLTYGVDGSLLGQRMIGGINPGTTFGGKGSRYEDVVYVWVPEDGIYPFELEWENGGGGASVILREERDPTLNNGGLMESDFEYPNYGSYIYDTGTGSYTANPYPDTFTKMYVTLCNVPAVDADADGDVDEADFGVLQACLGATGPLSVECRCMDLGGTAGTVTADDYAAFLDCWTGPNVPWVSTPQCP